MPIDTTRCTRRPATVVDGQMTARLRQPGRTWRTTAGLRQLRRQHGSAVQPPYCSNGPFIPLIDDTKYPNIGDRLTAKGISLGLVLRWLGRRRGRPPGRAVPVPPPAVQLLRGVRAGPAGPAPPAGRDRLLRRGRGSGNLPTVSFVKPYGAENEHPGYASANSGSMHLVDLIKAVENGPQADDTLIVVTYDEFGGQWDHVSPPGAGSSTPGAVRRVRSGHPHPGAAAVDADDEVGCRPHVVRHDVDHRHPGAGLRTRRRSGSATPGWLTCAHALSTGGYR